MKFNKFNGLIAVVAVFTIISVVITATTTTKSVNSADQESVSQFSEEYILKDYNGYLAVFYADAEKPYMEFDIKTSSFQKYDQNLLKEGIRATGEEAIRKLIEDYTE